MSFLTIITNINVLATFIITIISIGDVVAGWLMLRQERQRQQVAQLAYNNNL